MFFKKKSNYIREAEKQDRIRDKERKIVCDTFKQTYDIGATKLQPYYKKLDKRIRPKDGYTCTPGSALFYLPFNAMKETGVPEELYRLALGQSLYCDCMLAYNTYRGYLKLEDERQQYTNKPNEISKINIDSCSSFNIPYAGYMMKASGENRFFQLFFLYILNQKTNECYNPAELVKEYAEYAKLSEYWNTIKTRGLTLEEFIYFTCNQPVLDFGLRDDKTEEILSKKESIEWIQTAKFKDEHVRQDLLATGGYSISAEFEYTPITRQWVITHDPIEWCCNYIDFMWKQYAKTFAVLYQHGASNKGYQYKDGIKNKKIKELSPQAQENIATLVRFGPLQSGYMIFEYFGWDKNQVLKQFPTDMEMHKIYQMSEIWESVQQLDWQSGELATDWWF